MNEEIIIILKRIELRLINIENDMKILKDQNHKMETHVDFVNGIYDQVKSPFHYIMQKTDKMFVKDTTNRLFIER